MTHSQQTASFRRIQKHAYYHSMRLAMANDSVKHNYSYTKDAHDNFKKLLLLKKALYLEKLIYNS